jgi:DCN1-like protein 1/2
MVFVRCCDSTHPTHTLLSPKQHTKTHQNSDKIATECLRATGWSVEAAIEHFYASGLAAAGGGGHAANQRAVEDLFAKYADPSSGAILAEGVGQLCDDLGVDPSDIVMVRVCMRAVGGGGGGGGGFEGMEGNMTHIKQPTNHPPHTHTRAQLVLSWHLNAATMCEYSRDEFVGGLQRLGVDGLEALKRRLPSMRDELADPGTWREVYNYAFGWAKEVRFGGVGGVGGFVCLWLCCVCVFIT